MSPPNIVNAPRSTAPKPLQFRLQLPNPRLRPLPRLPFLDTRLPFPDKGFPFLNKGLPFPKAGLPFPIQFLAHIFVGGDMPPGQRVNPSQRRPFPAQDQV